jgi:hypothetical protein
MASLSRVCGSEARSGARPAGDVPGRAASIRRATSDTIVRFGSVLFAGSLSASYGTGVRYKEEKRPNSVMAMWVRVKELLTKGRAQSQDTGSNGPP